MFSFDCVMVLFSWAVYSWDRNVNVGTFCFIWRPSMFRIRISSPRGLLTNMTSVEKILLLLYLFCLLNAQYYLDLWYHFVVFLYFLVNYCCSIRRAKCALKPLSNGSALHILNWIVVRTTCENFIGDSLLRSFVCLLFSCFQFGYYYIIFLNVLYNYISLYHLNTELALCYYVFLFSVRLYAGF